MSTEMERLDKHRSAVRIRSGPASYIDTGGAGRPVLLAPGLAASVDVSGVLLLVVVTATGVTVRISR